MTQMDKRPEAEIQFGAALNVVEPLELDLDELVVTAIGEPDTPADMMRELVLARHHLFEMRRRLTWIFERTARNSLFLKLAGDLRDGHTAMKQAREHYELLIGNIATAQMAIFSMEKTKGGPWKHDALWQRIRRRMEDVPAQITIADRSLAVAGLTASGNGS